MAIHPDLVPLSFLLGRWEGAGIGGYPTIESFRFGQEVTFGHNDKPFLIYHSRTWKLDEEGNIGVPLGTESGFGRPRPDSQVEVMLAHPTGIVEIYLGEITGTRIEMATDVVARTATAKEVTAGHRLYGLAGAGPGPPSNPGGGRAPPCPTPSPGRRSPSRSNRTCRRSSNGSAAENRAKRIPGRLLRGTVG